MSEPTDVAADAGISPANLQERDALLQLQTEMQEELQRVMEHGDEQALRRLLEKIRALQKRMLAFVPDGGPVRVPRYKPKRDRQWDEDKRRALQVARSGAVAKVTAATIRAQIRRHSLSQLVLHEMTVLKAISSANLFKMETRLAVDITRVLRCLADMEMEELQSMDIGPPLPDFLPQFAETEEEARRRRAVLFASDTGPFAIGRRP